MRTVRTVNYAPVNHMSSCTSFMIAVLPQLELPKQSVFFSKSGKKSVKRGVRVVRARSSRASPARRDFILSVFSLDYVNVFPRANFVSSK